MNEYINKYLRSIYYNPTHPSSFGSINNLHKTTKLKFPGIPKEFISDWLKEQYTYTLHKNSRKRFLRNRIYVSQVDEQWEADLVDMQEFSTKNNGFKYILTVIDILSKYLWAIPIKSKNSKNIVLAFDNIFKTRKPLKIKTDKGREFENNEFKNLCVKNNINFFTSQDKKIKCSIVERVNRTLKNKMFKYFTANGTRKYIDVLQNLVNSYNNKVHRSIKLKPSEVNKSNEIVAYNNLYGSEKLKTKLLNNTLKSKSLPIDATVRLNYELGPFDKSYYPNWTDQTYKVSKSIARPQKFQYEIKDYNGNKLNQKFYLDELQKVSPNTEYRIEKIIRKKKFRGKLEFLVKWMGYSSSFNSWISGKQLILLRKQINQKK